VSFIWQIVHVNKIRIISGGDGTGSAVPVAAQDNRNICKSGYLVPQEVKKSGFIVVRAIYTSDYEATIITFYCDPQQQAVLVRITPLFRDAKTRGFFH
jgi:hypothetical protein